MPSPVSAQQNATASEKSHFSRLLSPGFLVLLASAVVLLGNWIRPFPFSTTDDNWMYFLPLIKAHTDAVLGGHPLRMLWSLGSGWSPWENAQVGVLYVPYHLANLVARFIGHPLALLEVSTWMHLSAVALVARSFAPLDRPESERMAWGLLAMLAPGPLLLGLNWHNYLSCYPWFLALAFLLQRIVSRIEFRSSRRERLLIGFCSLGFFVSSHAQMYVLGIGILLLWALAEQPHRSHFRRLLPFLWAQLPALIPLLYLKMLSLDGTQDWMGDRGDSYYLLRHAQTLGAVLHGTLFGNLLYTRDFQLWANISWTGVGIFFSPALVLLCRPLWQRRKWSLGVFFLFALVFMGAASYPTIRHLGFGPLAGFRWTWKICIFIGPLALASLLLRFQESFPRRSPFLLGTIAGLSLLVFLRGLSFEIWPSLEAAHPFGAERLAMETRRMASMTGLLPGSRVALVGPFDMMQPLPLPVLGLVGNAPILAGLEAAHIYEPMEPSRPSREHYGLSLPWRVVLPETLLFQDPEKIMDALRRIGVQAVITISPQARNFQGARPYVDPLGRTLWVLPVPAALTGPFPAALGQKLARKPSGILLAPPSPRPPTLITSRPVTWEPSSSGWVGVPESLPLGWALISVVVLILTTAGLVWGKGDTPHGPDASP